MKKSLIAALLGVCFAGSAAHAQQAASCQDLREVGFERPSSHPSTRMLDLIASMVQGTGWKVQSNLKAGRGPAVSGGLSFVSTEDAVRYVVEQAVDAGWRIDLVLNRANCTIALNVDPAQASSAAVAVSAGTTLAEAAAAASSGFNVYAEDKTVREVLKRWAANVNWTFRDEHWTLDRDLPVLGAVSAEHLGEDFRTAVRTLLASTELTDRPVQPCFYTNHVLRVIPLAASCQPSVAFTLHDTLSNVTEKAY